MSEPLCPFSDGRHKIVVTEWGRVCVRCHKTWEWRGKEIVPTYGAGGVDSNPRPAEYGTAALPD